MPRRGMTVQALLKILQSAPPDAVVLLPSSDHSYRPASASVTQAALADGEYSEWWGPEYAEEGIVPVPAVVIS